MSERVRGRVQPCTMTTCLIELHRCSLQLEMDIGAAKDLGENFGPIQMSAWWTSRRWCDAPLRPKAVSAFATGH